MGPEPQYDWESMETDYVTGSITYRELARKYGVSESRIGTVGGKKRWATKRQEYRERLKQEAVERTLEIQVADKVGFDVLTDNACDGMLRRIARAVVEDKFNAKDLIQLPGALKTIQDVKYRRLDIPAPTQRHEISRVKSPMETLVDEINALDDEKDEKRYQPVEVKSEDKGNGSDADETDDTGEGLQDNP